MILKKVSLLLTFLLFISVYSTSAQNEEWCIQDAEILTASGETAMTSCYGVGANLVKFKTSQLAQAFAFAVVDENNTILYVGLTSTIDLASFGAGAFKVYAFSYQGQLTAQVGDDLFNTELAGFCYGLTTNFISVNNVSPDGGLVATDSGETETTVCVGDAVADLIQFTTDSDSPASYIYVITDNNNNILDFSVDGAIDFNNSPVGECHLWGAAYAGDILLEVGDNITSSDFASECFDLSDNFVTIHREQPNGGEIAFADGSDFVNACQGGNQGTGIGLMNTGNLNLSYAYILVDENGLIVSQLVSDYISFSSLPIGISNVYGVSFSGDLVLSIGEDINTATFSEQCFELASNFISVERQELGAGVVSLETGEVAIEVCAEDASDLDLTFSNTATGGGEYTYFIVNEDNIILDYATDGGYDFFGFPSGSYGVYGVAYTGLFNPVSGEIYTEDIAFSNLCFGVSAEPLSIEIINVNGGTPGIDVDGDVVTSYIYCSTETETITIVNADFSGANVGIVVTDETGAILQVSSGNTFVPEIDGPHSYTIYSIAYSGTLDESINSTTQPDVTLDDAQFADKCFALSATGVALEVVFVDGGELAFGDGSKEAFICANDDISGTQEFGSSSAASGNYAYLLTDEDNFIYSAVAGNTANFALLDIGNYRLHGVSFSGELILELGDDIFDATVSDGCFDISTNFLSLEVTNVFGGQISTQEDDLEYFICPASAEEDFIVLSHANDIGTGYQYFITDLNGVITEVIAADTVRFTDWAEGSYILRGVSLTGSFTGTVGDNILAGGLSDGCYDLSENNVVVNYYTPTIGTFTTLEGDTSLEFCVGDGNSDLVSFLINDASISEVIYLITEEDGTLIGSITDSEFDFENAIGGIVRIYALVYTGNLGVLPGDNIFDIVELSNDCWDLSDDFILIDKTKVDGGVIFTDFGANVIYTCSDDGISDMIKFVTSSFAPTAEYSYVITNLDNQVISVMGNDTLDVESTGFSSLKVWGVSYTGTLLIGFGDDIETSALSDGCYHLSENSITVLQGTPEGGEIDYLGDTEILVCVGQDDGQLAVTTSSTQNAGYAFLLLDFTGVIISVSEGPVDMTIVDPGNYRIWGLSYTGVLLAAPGLLATQVELSTSCYELSTNFILVEKGEDVDGGEITDDISGEDIIYTCPGDGVADLVAMITTSDDPTYHYVITDEDGIVTHPQIIGNVINFDAAPPSIARIYGISLNGTSNIEAGTNLFEDALSTQCYTTSSNFITVIPITPAAGLIDSDQGVNVAISVIDTLSDEVSFNLIDATPHAYQYIVVNDGGEIVGIQENNTFDFALFSVGVYQVYGIALVGEVEASIGEDFDGAVFSNDCFSVTENFVTVSVVDSLIEEEEIFAMQAESIMQVAIFPNPTSNYVNVSIDKTSVETGRISVFNVFGAVVYEIEISAQEEVTIDLQNLVSGLYYVAVNVGEEMQVIRVVKK